MSIRYFTLDENDNVVPVDKYVWLDLDSVKANRIVKKTEIGEVEVSTIFLGMFFGSEDEVPLVFETVIFGGEFDQSRIRYASKAEALEGHDIFVKVVKGQLSMGDIGI